MSVGGEGDGREICATPVNVHEGSIRRVVEFAVRVSNASEVHGAKVHEGIGPQMVFDGPPSAPKAKTMRSVLGFSLGLPASGKIYDVDRYSRIARGSKDADRDMVTSLDGQFIVIDKLHLARVPLVPSCSMHEW